MIHQPILNIAEIFARKNILNVIISPGSRSAPLTIAFARHKKIKTKVIPDERSAAFVGLGMAMTLGQPVGLVCTSGSAALNYYPAIAEAFFQKIPLIVLTADRPKEWIGQQDGQTIYQHEVFSKHIKRSYEVSSDFNHKDAVWYTERIISEAINLSQEEPKGPVHINIPLREPLYHSGIEDFISTQKVKVVDTTESKNHLSEKELQLLKSSFFNSKKKVVVAGQGVWKGEELAILEKVISLFNVPVVGDILSNLHSIDSVVNTADSFLGTLDEEKLKELQPELLITFGDSVISKSLKIFLRNFKPVEHWHIQPAGIYADTFQSVTKIIRTDPGSFFSFLVEEGKVGSLNSPETSTYFDLWNTENKRSSKATHDFFTDKPFSEFEAVKYTIEALPDKPLFHIANSMPVRYANYIGLKEKKDSIVYVNRGTSGIDGCTSTAVGAAMSTEKQVVLLTGDIAFFYDRNAFWHNYNLPNLRVIILNNHGGGIFGLIDGPGDLPEREEFFETTQKLTAENTAKDFGLDYYFCNVANGLKSILKDFFNPSQKGKILEIETDKSINREVFKSFKNVFRKNK